MSELSHLRTLLKEIKTGEAWPELWRHLEQVRDQCLEGLLQCNSWDEYLEKRGELNALNRWFEFGDDLLERLVEVERERDGRRGDRGPGAGRAAAARS